MGRRSSPVVHVMTAEYHTLSGLDTVGLRVVSDPSPRVAATLRLFCVARRRAIRHGIIVRVHSSLRAIRSADRLRCSAPMGDVDRTGLVSGRGPCQLSGHPDPFRVSVVCACSAGPRRHLRPGSRTGNAGPWPLVTHLGFWHRRRYADSRCPSPWLGRSDRRAAPGDNRRLGRGNRGATA